MVTHTEEAELMSQRCSREMKYVTEPRSRRKASVPTHWKTT